MLLTLGAFVFVLGVLIFVHEVGHFLAAKAVGIAVPRFSIGIGPATPFKFRWGETEYRLAWLPFGGYVKMASKEEQETMGVVEGGPAEEEFPPDRMFEHKPLGARILVISAGVIMNAIFAWLAYSGLAAVYGGFVEPTTVMARADSAALPASASALARVPFGTQILRVNGDSVRSWDAIVDAVIDLASDRLRFDFAGGIDPVILAIPGTDAEARVAIADAMVPLLEPRVAATAPGQPAEAAGLLAHDLVLRADGESVRTWTDLVQIVETNAEDSVRLDVLRADTLVEIVVVPSEEPVQDPETGEVRRVGRIGIERERIRVRYGPGEAVVWGARETWGRARLVLFTLKGMIFGRISPRELGGPILIGQVSGQFARMGGSALLGFMAFLSVNLAILNLLPIPVLDGGHLVFLFVEGVRGRPLSLTMRIRMTQVGLFVLLGIMVLALTNDLLRVIGA